MKCMAMALGLVSIASLAAAQTPVTGTVTGAQPAPPPAMTNLQIIPKDTPRPQVLATMQAFTQSLGVQCNYCHVQEGDAAAATTWRRTKADQEGRARHDGPGTDQHRLPEGDR
jgi:hypothetical protein